jgi:prepilin-type N-terminal cleavage/methylation domain-containing protein
MNRRNERPVPGESGFTLVELLVSITLFAILSVLLAGALRTGSRAATVGEQRIDRTTQIAVAETAIRGQLAGVLPVAVANSTVLLFDGRSDGVDFVGLPPAYLAPGGFHRLSLEIAPSPAGQQLVLRWQPMTKVPEEGEMRPAIVLDHLEHVAFAYYGARDYNEAPQWRDEWQGAIRLPSLIRLHFLFLDRHDVPDLVVALRLAQADAGIAAPRAIGGVG